MLFSEISIVSAVSSHGFVLVIKGFFGAGGEEVDLKGCFIPSVYT